MGVVRPTTDLERRVAPFKVVSDFSPAGDQPTAIDDLERRIREGERDVVLLGATGTVRIRWRYAAAPDSSR